MARLERVILSSDFSPRFLNFITVSAFFWQSKFKVKPDIAIVYPSKDQRQVSDFEQEYGSIANLHLLKAAPDAPIGNQAKIARLYLAAMLESAFSTIDDLDTVHVKPEYLNSKFENVPKGKMLAIGREVYEDTPHEGGFPMGNFSGSSEQFRSLLNLRDFHPEVGFRQFVERFRGSNVLSKRENPYNPPKGFSDEYMLRGLRRQRDFDSQIHFDERALDIRRSWLDRSWWPPSEEITSRKLEYEAINFPRPFWENRKRINEALEILEPDFISTPIPIPFGLTEWRFRRLLDSVFSRDRRSNAS